MTVTMSSAAGSGYAGREVWGAFIDGAFADAADAPTFPVMEPATGRQLARVVSGDRRPRGPRGGGSAAGVRAVARHASARARRRCLRAGGRRRSGTTWTSWPSSRRARSASRGATRCASTCPTAHAAFDYYAGPGRDAARRDHRLRARSRRGSIYEPYGVVAAILPFNWPPLHFTQEDARPALAAGNTVVIKPGEQAPLTVLRLVELVERGAAAGRGERRDPAWPPAPALAAQPAWWSGSRSPARRAPASAVLRSRGRATSPTRRWSWAARTRSWCWTTRTSTRRSDVAIEGMFYNQGEACTSTARLLVHSSRSTTSSWRVSAPRRRSGWSSATAWTRHRHRRRWSTQAPAATRCSAYLRTAARGGGRAWSPRAACRPTSA